MHWVLHLLRFKIMNKDCLKAINRGIVSQNHLIGRHGIFSNTKSSYPYRFPMKLTYYFLMTSLLLIAGIKTASSEGKGEKEPAQPKSPTVPTHPLETLSPTQTAQKTESAKKASDEELMTLLKTEKGAGQKIILTEIKTRLRPDLIPLLIQNLEILEDVRLKMESIFDPSLRFPVACTLYELGKESIPALMKHIASENAPQKQRILAAAVIRKLQKQLDFAIEVDRIIRSFSNAEVTIFKEVYEIASDPMHMNARLGLIHYQPTPDEVIQKTEAAKKASDEELIALLTIERNASGEIILDEIKKRLSPRFIESLAQNLDIVESTRQNFESMLFPPLKYPVARLLWEHGEPAVPSLVAVTSSNQCSIHKRVVAAAILHNLQEKPNSSVKIDQLQSGLATAEQKTLFEEAYHIASNPKILAAFYYDPPQIPKNISSPGITPNEVPTEPTVPTFDNTAPAPQLKKQVF